jgi:hypothetical protein
MNATAELYYSLCKPPGTANATYNGQPPNRGTLVPYEVNGEGFAVLRCGGTEVLLSYTLLHHLSFHVDPQSSMFAPMVRAQNALDAITCEASLRRTPN